MKILTTHTLVLILSLVCSLLSAQDKNTFTIQGEVLDSLTEETLIGVNIYLKDSKYGTVSDENGYYYLSVLEGSYLLIFSCIGYKPKEIEIILNRNITFNTVLNPVETPIEEVQITAQRKFFGNMEYGREISTIGSEVIEKQNVNNASDILHARLAGVWATKTSGAPGDHQKIRIRGQSSFFSSAEPLYVVDGVPVPIVNLSSLGIADMNIHDIENVTVLKDASSTSLYGFQGGNGVILIDTKQGGENRINFSMKTGLQWFNNFYDLMSTEDQLTALDSAYSKMSFIMRSFYPDPSDTFCNHDRQKEIFSPGILQEYQLSASGTLSRIKYYASGNYTDHQGILPDSEYKRYTFSTRLSRILWKRLAVDLAYRGSMQENKNNQDEYQGNRLIWEGISKSPCLECTPDSLIYDDEGRMNIRILDNYGPLKNVELPRSIIENNHHKLNITTHTISGFSRLQINDHFSMDIMESFMLRTTDYIAKFEYNHLDWYGYTGIKNVDVTSREDVILYNHQANLSYYNSFGKHNISFVFAHRFYKDNLWWHVDTLEGTLEEHFSLKNSMAAYGLRGSVLRNMSSYVGHISYNYRNAYFLSAIANVSKIKEGMYIDYYSFFPSLAVNWDLAQEKLLKRIPWISMLNVYINWGRSGNYPLNGLANDLYEDVPYASDDQAYYYPAVKQLANHYLRHESTTETDYGLKSSFFKRRLSLSVSYFDKSISDLIIQRDIPYYYGGGKMFQNVGRISVKGLELTAEALPIQTSLITWYISFNFSDNSQIVEMLSDGETMKFTDYDILIPEFVIEENQGLGDIYGYRYLGQWTDADWEDNSNRYVYVQGSKFLNADSTDSQFTESDKVALGNSIPDFTWNFSSSFQYKNFSIEFQGYAAWGQEKYNATRAATIMTAVNREVNQYITDTVRMLRYNEFYESSEFIEDASFIRLKSLSLHYTPEKKLMHKAELTFSISFENLITITKYKGFDPEATIFTDNNFSDNSIDRGAYPNPKAVYASINLKF